MNQSVHYSLFQNQLVRYCQLLVKPGGGRPHTVRTTRTSAFPLIIRAYPSAAFARGYFSIIGRTPVISANSKVSCESVGMPPAQPLTPFCQKATDWAPLRLDPSCAAALVAYCPFSFCAAHPRASSHF